MANNEGFNDVQLNQLQTMMETMMARALEPTNNNIDQLTNNIDQLTTRLTNIETSIKIM